MYLRNGFLALLAAAILGGCAAYKELQPEPAVSFIASGFIEIKDDDDNFELDEGNKYFIRFPQPTTDNIYLVLVINNKPNIRSYLTRAFDGGETPAIKINDESDDPINLSLFSLDRSIPTFYWVIEEVNEDMILQMEYRYVARWRYKFETKQAQFEQIYQQNRQPRFLLDSIGVSIQPDQVNFEQELQRLSARTDEIRQVNEQLSEIESIFPENILNSEDASYRQYVEFKNKVATQLIFQERFYRFLDIYNLFSTKRASGQGTIKRLPEILDFFDQSDTYPKNVSRTAAKLLNPLIPDAVSFVESEIRQKENSTTIEYNPFQISRLYDISGRTKDKEFSSMKSFIEAYNTSSDTYQSVTEEIESMKREIREITSWPGNTFYTELRVRLSQLRYKMPKNNFTAFAPFGSYQCSKLLNGQISKLRREIGNLDSKYSRAESLVPQINLLRNRDSFPQIVRLLRQNSDLEFLLNQYAALDQTSLEEQRGAIYQSMNRAAWLDAENKIESLYNDTNFIFPSKIAATKSRIIKSSQDTLLNRIESNSLRTAQSFLSDQLNSFLKIDSLYSNPNLNLAHLPSFISSGSAQVKSRVEQIRSSMEKFKYETFPAQAIENLYRDFTQNPYEQGVEKARAIVTHGKYYRGSNNKIKNLIDECDPTVAKWMTKPKKYRKIYALPTTTNIGGRNEYLCKLNIQIPSDAQFPVFEINLKLPRELVSSGSTTAWYDKMYFNRKLLKNEGRFTIIAPTSENNYEAQITPLQVNKKGNNILEIRFKHSAFKVLEVSAMAQKPIIRKN
jgi:hypothetical protein